MVRLPRISNFTDVDALGLEPALDVYFASTPRALAGLARAGAAVRDASGDARVLAPVPPGANPVRGGEPSHVLQET